ncbi:MAG: aminotransferase class I/II-fold pyridoxal phosphate-dependent enzyme [Patescibacteria group bacterium]|nr:aminotransferase class I/II-fold pyridoxal phosphate-dependent enzyme [Patescibacteria group bacterium]
MKKPLRLYWGENYTPKSIKIQKIIDKASQQACESIHLYPGELQLELKKEIAKKYKVNIEQIFLGNGIENLIHLSVRALTKQGDKVAFLSPTFPVFETAADTYEMRKIEIPIKIGKKLQAINLLKSLVGTKLFYLAYPNNPTGQYVLSLKELKVFASKYSGKIILDECYWGIGKKTGINLISKSPNIIVMRSLSKSSGLAGLRFGFSISNKTISQSLHKYSTKIEADSLNSFTCCIAKKILPLTEELSDQYVKFKAAFINNLKKKTGLETIRNETSFILAVIPEKINVSVLMKELKQTGYETKDCSKYDYFPMNILMFAVPPEDKWPDFFSDINNSLFKYKKGG